MLPKGIEDAAKISGIDTSQLVRCNVFFTENGVVLLFHTGRRPIDLRNVARFLGIPQLDSQISISGVTKFSKAMKNLTILVEKDIDSYFLVPTDSEGVMNFFPTSFDELLELVNGETYTSETDEPGEISGM